MLNRILYYVSRSTSYYAEGRPGMSDVFPCLESQGCHLIPLSYLLFVFLLSPLTPSVLSFFSSLSLVSVHSFFVFFFNLVSIIWMQWSMIPACPSLMCSVEKGSIEGTNSSKTVFDVIYEKSFEM